MNAVERLRRDHGILRAKLDVVESALRMGPETWYVLREVCFTLVRQLRDHIRREETLVAACRRVLTPKALAEVALEHKDEPEHLRTLERLFTRETGRSYDRVAPELMKVVEGLRRHMAEEEQELFPLLEHALTEQELLEVFPPSTPGRFDEAMTVNRVVQECPETRPTFERLFISIPLEGYCCLDEVAWRHGLEAEELLEVLEAVIATCQCQGAEASTPTEAVSMPEEVGTTTQDGRSDPA